MQDIYPVGEWRNSDPINLHDTRTRPLLLYFWRSETPESIEALHELDHIVRESKDFPLDIVAVHAPEYADMDDDWEEVIEHLNIDLPVMHDPEYRTWERFGVQHAPSYVVIDQNGDEIFRRVGSVDDSGLRDFIDDIQ